MSDLKERLRYCQEHGLFIAALADMVASYEEAADAIEALETQLAEANRRLAEIAELTKRRQLPLTHQINDIAAGPQETCRICGHTTDSKIHEWCERKDNV